MKRARKIDKTKSARGGHRRAEVLTPERRQEIARQAAVARWSQPRPPPTPTETTCRAEETGRAGTVTCEACGLTWRMDDPNYPLCPRIAGLKVLPPVTVIEERAKRIAFKLLHGGDPADFAEQYPHRPDWQGHVEYLVTELMEACSDA